MPTFDQHKVSTRTQLLLVGNSGSGKTYALATLVKAGYTLYVLDFDNGMDILASLVTPEEAKRIHYITLRDEYGKKPTAWLGFRSILKDGWRDNPTDPPIPLNTLDNKSVVVIDSLSLAGEAALNQARSIESYKDPRLFYADASEWMGDFLNQLTGSSLSCNIVINTHIQLVEDAQGIIRMYPTSVGKNFSVSKLGRYFNTIIRTERKPNKTYVFQTIADNNMDLKNTAPNLLKAEMPPDLALIFKTIQDNAKQLQGAT